MTAPAYLTQAELKALFGVIDGRRDKAIWTLAYRHGLRASEVGLLQRGDISLERRRIYIRRLKGSISAEYPLQSPTMKALRAWLRTREDRSPVLFPSNRGEPIGRATLAYHMKRYGEMAALPAHKRHFHILKHSIAVHLLDADADIMFVKDWLGHKRIDNTLVYARLVNRTRDRKAQAIFASPQIVE